MLGGLPKNADYVKIPTLARTGTPESRPPHLPLEVRRITEMRQRIVKETLLAFQPDVFLVDNFPLGARRELLPVLRAVRELPTKTMLGLRDIVDHDSGASHYTPMTLLDWVMCNDAPESWARYRRWLPNPPCF